MAYFDEGTVAFGKATDYIKSRKGIDFKEIASQLGIKQTRFDFIRTKRSKVREKEIEKIISLFPETKHFFETPQTLNEPDAPNYQVGDISMRKPLCISDYGPHGVFVPIFG